MSGNVFLKRGSTYSLTEGNFSISPVLDDGIYQIHQNPMTGELFLVRIAEEFHFGFKLYGIDEKLVKHVLDTYNKQPSKKNLGVLLNGAKGTGKTVTAKILANRLGLPIILCDRPYPGLANFLAGIAHDCVFFFDEFEKNFSDKDSSILQIMDGVYTSEYRRIFLLTTNETHINDNLISRPSRLRYIHEFGNLEPEITREYLNDTLNDKSRIEDIIDFVDTLQISTIDILKSIVEEINIFGFDKFMENKEFFNVKTASYTYITKRVYIRNEDELHNYSIDAFLADLKLFEKRPSRYNYSDDTEFNKVYTEYKKSIRHEPDYRTLSDRQKSFKALKVGDSVGCYSGERVIFVDYKRQVFVTKDYDDDDYYFYFIENPNQRPSLTKEYLTNPYIGLM